MTRAKAPDRERAARAVAEFLSALGRNIEGELVGTPERVASAWIDELCAGYAIDPGALLQRGVIDLGEGPHGVVALRRIGVAAVCPHHLLPSHGFATVAYLPKRRAAGLGTIAGAASALAQRLTLQEALGREIAETVMRALDAKGALCRLDLVHTCFVARGERQSGSTLTTIAFAGSFAGPDREIGLAAISGDPEGVR